MSGEDSGIGVRVPVPPASAIKPAGLARARELGAITAKTRHNLWIKWAEIAMAHERQALAARRRAERIDGTDGLGEAFEDEFLAALVTVSASAFALEAFGNHVEDWLGISVPKAVVQQKGRVPAAVRMGELAKGGFDVAAHAQRWEAQVRRLFDLRNDAVHFRAEWHETVPHATGKSNVSREQTIYSAEEATRSVDLALEVITTCLGSPRSDQPQVAEWASNAAHVERYLVERRAKELRAVS